jgi:copper chaperone
MGLPAMGRSIVNFPFQQALTFPSLEAPFRGREIKPRRILMELRIDSMTCGGCARSVTKAIQSVDPSARVEADPASRTVKVETTATAAAILQVLEKAFYPATTN